jgi:hypothetical protein
MSSITKNQGVVHYEALGRSRPAILLHGWLGSWGLSQEPTGSSQTLKAFLNEEMPAA